MDQQAATFRKVREKKRMFIAGIREWRSAENNERERPQFNELWSEERKNGGDRAEGREST